MFKEQYNFEDRLNESRRINLKFPDRIPVIVEKSKGKDTLQEYKLDKKKFLVPSDMSIGQFSYTIRKRMILPPEKAVFIFINDKLIPCSATIGSIYNQESDDDGFLYILLHGENTFGL